MTDKKFWKIVKKLGWGTLSTDSDVVGLKLAHLVDSIDDIKEMHDISRLKREELSNVIDKFMENPRNKKYRYWGGDDSYWDFTAHIVGLGEEIFMSVIKNLLI